MMLFLGILTFVASFIILVLAAVALTSMALSGASDRKPFRVITGITGIILIATTSIWLLVITVDQPNAPHTTCGASSMKETP